MPVKMSEIILMDSDMPRPVKWTKRHRLKYSPLMFIRKTANVHFHHSMSFVAVALAGFCSASLKKNYCEPFKFTTMLKCFIILLKYCTSMQVPSCNLHVTI